MTATNEFELHEIRVQGHLDDHWADWLEGLAFTHEGDGTTTLTVRSPTRPPCTASSTNFETWRYRSSRFNALPPGRNHELA
jgi:hypothetical protein